MDNGDCRCSLESTVSSPAVQLRRSSPTSGGRGWVLSGRSEFSSLLHVQFQTPRNGERANKRHGLNSIDARNYLPRRRPARSRRHGLRSRSAVLRRSSTRYGSTKFLVVRRQSSSSTPHYMAGVFSTSSVANYENRPIEYTERLGKRRRSVEAFIHSIGGATVGGRCTRLAHRLNRCSVGDAAASATTSHPRTRTHALAAAAAAVTSADASVANCQHPQLTVSVLLSGRSQ